MLKFFETKEFHMFFSIIIGIALVSLFRPLCKGDECRIVKAPPLNEVEKTTYKIGAKCYQFKTHTTECSDTGIIESYVDAPLSAQKWTPYSNMGLADVKPPPLSGKCLQNRA